jgi:anti-sigma B factor antagonist
MTLGGQVLAKTEPFRCDVVPNGDGMAVAPRGELDMATVGAVEQELRRLRRKGCAQLVLDLRGLTFMDSTGLHLVTRWATEASRDGFEFEVEPGPPIIQRVFELAQMTNGVPFRRPG